jgi:hypothetical protein
MAQAYAPWFSEKESLFQLGKMAFSPAFAFLPSPWVQMIIGHEKKDTILKEDSGLKYPASLGKREDKSRTKKEEWISCPSKKVGSFLALVPPCLAKHPGQTLMKCRVGLKSRGKVTIGIIPQNSSWRKFFVKKMGGSLPTDRRVQFYSLEEMEHLLMKAGFTIQGLFSTLFQRPGQIITPEIPLNGYHPRAGLFVLIGEKPD